MIYNCRVSTAGQGNPDEGETYCTLLYQVPAINYFHLALLYRQLPTPLFGLPEPPPRRRCPVECAKVEKAKRESPAEVYAVPEPR